MEALRCHSNQTSPIIRTRTQIISRIMSISCMHSNSFILLMVLENTIFEYFTKIYALRSWQPIKFSNLDKIHTMKRKGLLIKPFYKNPNIPIETEKNVNLHFSHYMSMENISCHSNQSTNPTETKNTIYVEANVHFMYAKY